MRVAYFTGTFLPKLGGIEVLIHNLMLCLHRNKIDIAPVLILPPHLYYSNLKKVPYRTWFSLSFYLFTLECKIKNIPFFRPLYGLIHLLYLVDYLQLALFVRPHVFHFHHLSSGSLVDNRLVRRFLKIPVVLTPHGSDVQHFSSSSEYGLHEKPFNTQMYKRLLANPYNQLTAISSTIKRDILNLSHRSSVTTIHNFPSPNLKTSSPRKLQSKKSVSILTLGRNHPKKNFSIIPTISAELHSRDFAHEWYVCGRGCSKMSNLDNSENLLLFEDIQELSLTRSLYNPESIDYYDHIPSLVVSELFSMFDLFVFPSLLEGLPVVVLEAMASGLPVIATNAPGFEDFESIIKVDHQSSSMAVLISEYILNITSSKKYYKDQVNKQLAEYSSKFSADLVLTQYYNLYANLSA